MNIALGLSLKVKHSETQKQRVTLKQKGETANARMYPTSRMSLIRYSIFHILGRTT